MTDNHIETALRAAMERRAAKVPSLPDDFAQQVMNKMNARKENANQHRVSIPLHYGRGWGWVLSIAAVLLIAFLLWPEKQETPITQPEAQPITAEVNPQPVPKPIVEEKKDETVMAEVQAKAQPVKKRRKAVRKQGTPGEEPVLTETEQPIHESDIEPMYAQSEEYATHYQTIQTVHLSSDVVVYVIEASDMPAVSTVPSVRELRARGLRLTDNVRQASQPTVLF